MSNQTSISNLIDEVAAAHSIHAAEATDEVFDAIEIIFAPEDRPEATVDAYQRNAIREYIAEQYRTNRTRL
jgi:RNA binding exosome subunit